MSVYGLVTGDFNGDGKLDIAAGAGGAFYTYTNPGAVAIFLGKGDGTFQAASLIQVGSPAQTPTTLAVADLNGDGKLDLVTVAFTADLTPSIIVLLGNGDGTFRQLPPITSVQFEDSPIAIADLNGDGIPDLIASGAEGAYLLGNGDGTFQSPQVFSSGPDPAAFAVADWNGDGVAGLAISLKAGLLAMESALNPKLSGVGNLTNISAAGGVNALAPGSLASVYGVDLGTGTKEADSTPLPITLNGSTVSIVDSAGHTTAAPLIFVSPKQINYLIPDSVATGVATVTAMSGDGTQSSGQIDLTTVAPALFTLNTDNLAAADAICVSQTGGQTVENVYQLVNGAVVPAPLNLNACAETVLEVFATGMDSITASAAQATIGGQPAHVTFAGPQGSFVGLDQINLVIPASVAGSGSAQIAVTVQGKNANLVNVTIQ